MTRFNRRSRAIPPTTPIVSRPSAFARTYNQAPGFERDPKSELFLLAVNNFVTQDTFYERGVSRDERFRNLIHEVTRTDPAWIKRFLPWLRREANMRTASIVGAVEAARTLVSLKIPGGRKLVDSVLARADEPGEMLAYWLSTYGRRIPKPIKRGIADAATRLYNERNMLKYDTESHGVRFGDVLELTHPAPDAWYQRTLFSHLIDRRHGRENERDINRLMMLKANRALRQVAVEQPEVLLDPETLRAAGMTWEDALSLAGSKVPKQELWTALIPSMGYMALLRNLRNFDQAGVSDAVAQQVIAKLTDPEEVARSRQLPMRFLSAYRAVSNLRWAYPLERALNLSLRNVPEFSGRTLILVDTSGSMDTGFSKDGELKRWDAAALFGLALAQRCEQVTVVSFGRSIAEFPMQPGESLLKSLERFKAGYFFGGGTPTRQAINQYYRGHDRVIVLTDEQANAHYGQGVFDSVPLDKLTVTFNLSGYQFGHAASGSATRVAIGGLSDQAFRLLPVLESRASGRWPF